MNKAVKLLETPESRCVELEEYASSSLDDGVSLAAVDDCGEFVGISVNGLVAREVRHFTTEGDSMSKCLRYLMGPDFFTFFCRLC